MGRSDENSVEAIEEKLMNIIRNTEFFSMRPTCQQLTSSTSIIKDLALDSIQLLEYLVTVENTLELNLDYQDLSIEVFQDFHTLATYFANKIQVEDGQ